MITIKVDDKGLERRFGLSAKQMRFATNKAINQTLLTAQTAQQRFMQRQYTIRKSGLLKASVRLQFSRPGTLTGRVFINPHLSHIWPIHESGGRKTPRSGRFVVVPMKARSGKRGSVPRSKRPRNLKKSFVIRSNGRRFIFQRQNKKTIRPMYHLQHSVNIRPSLNFQSNVEKAINGVMRRNLERAAVQELRRQQLV